jgi:N-acyl-D-aspartate/D-glutamate deacylase
MLDLHISGATVVDGTGAPGRRADVGVRDGRIVEIGPVTEAARRRIDADGLVVAPGFVDLHTHYDAQVFWDNALTPSPLCGVTTAVAGNCGFTVAPLAPEHADYLLRTLAKVEGMPVEALEHGVPWSWRSFAEYLDRVEAGGIGPNLGFLVGHTALRRIALGDAATEGPASDDQRAALARLLDESLAAGGLGFSSSWARTHSDGDGRMVPSRYADEEELVELCCVTRGRPGTTLEFIPSVGAFDDWQPRLMGRMSAVADRPLNWNLISVTAATMDVTEGQLAGSDVAAGLGGRVLALTIPMPQIARFSFASGFVFDMLHGWAEAMALPRPERRALFADPVRRRRLAELAAEEQPPRAIADWAAMTITECFTEETKRYENRLVADIAAEEGKDPFDALCDIVVADDLRTGFALPPTGDTDEDWEARGRVWRDPRVVIGASDAGAHLDLLQTFNYVPQFLGHGVRRRQLLPLEEAIRLVTDVPARLYGITGRGRIAEGWHADLVVFDPETVDARPVETRADLPGGAARLYGEADGIHHVLVNGGALVEDGRLTDARPGRLLRSGRDTETVTAR